MTEPVTYGDLIRSAARRISGVSDSAELDARVLIAKGAGLTTTQLFSRAREPLDDDIRQSCEHLIAQRCLGKPVAWLTGFREFWSREFRVTPDTLIPRPETELLVEFVLDHVEGNQNLAVADLGTGCGVIAVTLALERPHWSVFAVDSQRAALDVAAENALRLKAPHVYPFQGRWLTSFDVGVLDLVISNPPYVAAGDPHLDQGDVRFEPRSALVSGEDGLDDIRTIIGQATTSLRDGGRLVLEHGPDQGDAVRETMEAHGYRGVLTRRDLAGHPRLTTGLMQ